MGQQSWINAVITILLFVSCALLTTALLRYSWWHTPYLNIGLNGVCSKKGYITSTERCLSFTELMDYYGKTHHLERNLIDGQVVKEISYIRYFTWSAMLSCLFSNVLFLVTYLQVTKKKGKKESTKNPYSIDGVILFLAFLKALAVIGTMIRAVHVYKKNLNSSEHNTNIGASFWLVAMVIVTSVLVCVLIFIKRIIGKEILQENNDVTKSDIKIIGTLA